VLSSYPVACLYDGCNWTGNLVPTLVRGGAAAELAPAERAWLRCPRCRRDWEVRINNDRVTVMPAVERAGEPWPGDEP
jgi:hypothetical protein